MSGNFGDLRAGDLRHKISIMQKTLTTDTEGIPQESWVSFFSTMAAYMPMQGREYFQDSTINALQNAVFRIRWRPTMPNATMKVYSPFGNFNINAVTDIDGRHIELQIFCTQEVQNG